MDLSFLDKSSDVTPLLVHLYDSHKLYGLAKDKDPLARTELVSAVTDLLEMHLSPRESELIADVLIALIRQAEADLRGALADKLSVMDNAPLRLVLHMANDEIDIASGVLKNSPVLGELDLLYIIKSKGPEYWCQIAKRADLSNNVVNTLANTRDFDTALSLAENEKITLTESAISVLADMAQGHDILAMPLLRRDEVPQDIATQLYEFVGNEIKEFILENYDVDASQVNEAVDEVVLELIDIEQHKDLLPAESMVKAAERFKSKGLLTVNLMLGTLKRGQTQSFVAQFAQFAELEAETVIEMILQPNGQGLAVACKAFGILKPDFVSMFLLTSRVRRTGKVVDSKDIMRAIQYFDRIEPSVAKDIIANS